MHWESEAFMMYHEETETQVGKHYTNDLHHIEADKNNPSTSNFMIAFLFALSFGFMIVRLGKENPKNQLSLLDNAPYYLVGCVIQTRT